MPMKKARFITEIALAALVVVVLLIAWNNIARAEPPDYIETDIRKIKSGWHNGQLYLAWPYLDGQSFYCTAGGYPNVLAIWAMLDTHPLAENETVFAWIDRNKSALFPTGLHDYQVEYCRTLIPAERWIVDQYRTNPTRPVYEITANFPSVKAKIGDIAHGTSCGSHVAPYSAAITAYEWRRVTLPDQREGVSVCRRN